MGCRLELPVSGGGDGILKRFNTLLPEAGAVAEALIVDSANEFFRETERWRFESLFIDMETGDREMILDTGDQIDNIEIISIQNTIYEQAGHDEVPVTRKSDLTDHSYGKNHQYRNLQSIAALNYEKRQGFESSRQYLGLSVGGKEFYEPHPGHLILACAQECDATFRVPVSLSPISIAGLNVVPDGTLRAYREGIVSGAVVKAMMMPGKTWSQPTPTFNPDRMIALHKQIVDRDMTKAREWFARDDSEYRPYQGRTSVPESGYYD